MQITNDFREKILKALFEQRENFDGSDKAFSAQYGINNSVYSQLKKGKREGLLKDAQYLEIGMKLNVSAKESSWKIARTMVFQKIEADIKFCQENSKAMIIADEVGIGKTVAAKYLSRNLQNCFYVDAKQAKSKQAFVKLIAQTVGVDIKGRYNDIKRNLKYCLRNLPKAMVIIDDSGYLSYPAFMELLELWDATEGVCGWYQIGDDSLRAKIEQNISRKKVGYHAVFSRYSKRYSWIVPRDRKSKQKFYEDQFKQVFSVNGIKKNNLNELVRHGMVTDDINSYGDLRRAEGLVIHFNQKQKTA